MKYYYYLLLMYIECAVLKRAVHLQNLLNYKVNSQYKNTSFVYINIYMHTHMFNYLYVCIYTF